MKKQEQKRTEREEYLYHNTELLLKKYRDVVWSIEVSAIQAQINFENEMDCKIEEFLEMSYEARADLSGTDIQEQMRVMERNRKMLKLIELAVDILRKKKSDGELYYWILYYTYFSDKPIGRIEVIIDSVNDNIIVFSKVKDGVMELPEKMLKFINEEVCYKWTLKDTGSLYLVENNPDVKYVENEIRNSIDERLMFIKNTVIFDNTMQKVSTG